jgi:ferritin-like metal-binding protein YciE
MSEKSRPANFDLFSEFSEKKKGDSELRQFFVHALEELYDAEVQLTKAWPLMGRAASSKLLLRAFVHQLEMNGHQLHLLREVFTYADAPVAVRSCTALKGLVEDAEKNIEITAEGSMTRDAGLILHAQQISHFSMASYENLVNVAEALGEKKAAEVLSAIMHEKNRANDEFAHIAIDFINEKAAKEYKAD